MSDRKTDVYKRQVIALIGVIVLPITSGDTSLRALRMAIGDAFHIDQKSVGKRLGLAAVIFALVAVILVFAKSNADGFNILWRYFAWSNPVSYTHLDVYKRQASVPTPSDITKILVS